MLIADPGPLTDRLMEDKTLPFAVTLVANESPESTAVVARYKPTSSAAASKSQPLDLERPPASRPSM
jgi:hypothetical protein